MTDRLLAFAEAYLPHARAALAALAIPCGQSLDDHALDLTTAMVQAVQRAGSSGVAHYVVNARYGALTAACAELGVEPHQLKAYLA